MSRRTAAPSRGSAGTTPKPLEGIRVVDFGGFVAVPLSGQWLAFLGAEVLLIESRVSLPSRGFAPFAGEPYYNASGAFNNLNRNKRSCTINLRTEEGRGLVKSLVAVADVVQENFSPGTMEKLGLDYHTLRRIKPDIIMLSLSACGSTGPWRHHSALHSGVMGLSGVTAVTGYEGGHPRMLGAMLPDPISAMYSLFAILQALYHRQRTGQGQHIELAMTEALQTLLPDAIAQYTMLGREPERMGNRHPWKCPHNIYRTQGQDSWIAIAVSTDEEWQALCRVLDRPELAHDPRFANMETRRANVEALDAVITQWTRGRESQEEATRLLQAAGVPAGPANTVKDVVTDEHLTARGFVVEDDHPQAGRRTMVGVPWRFKGLPQPAYRHAPLLGQDNDYVLLDILGLSRQEVQRLTEAQVLY
ncbi:MAG: CoA transferase [Chloroflexi bacterium]|nr:CoA transferase [Chloroflexota bacterium]